MTRPLIYTKTRSKIAVRLPEQLVTAATKAAQDRGISFTRFAELAIVRHLDEIRERSAPWSPQRGELTTLQLRLPPTLVAELDGESTRLLVHRDRIIEAALTYALGRVAGDDAPYDWG